MPYINEELRKTYNDEVDEVVSKLISNSVALDQIQGANNNGNFKGDLNYIFFRIIRQFERNCSGIRFGYQQKSDIVGALKDCAAEYERRFLQPYEDEKIIENGDV